jgi:hypothetical protein
MSQVVLLEENQILNELISINLVNFLGIELIKRKSADTVLSLLDLLPEVNLIICQYEIGNENTAAIIQQYILLKKLDIGLMILGGPGSLDNEFTLTIKNPKNWEAVIDNAAKILGITDDVLAKKAIPDYVPVPVNYLLNLESVSCDVFIRIKQTPTTYQYVKRIHQNDNFTRDVILKYKEQGLEFFYIPKDQKKDFTTYLSNILVQKLEAPNLGLTPKLDLMGESYEVATKEILKLGFTTETIQLTEAIIHSIIINTEKSPELSFLLHKVINSKTPHLFQRCHMTAVIAIECLKNLKQNTHEAVLAVTFAAFFNDILLAEDLNLININSVQELANTTISVQERELVLNHALHGSQLVKKYPNIPKGVAELIKEHHGVSHGLGFSSEIETFSALSKVFIISYEFVLAFVRFKENKGEPRPITSDLYKKYPGDSCKTVIKALEKSLARKTA